MDGYHAMEMEFEEFETNVDPDLTQNDSMNQTQTLTNFTKEEKSILKEFYAEIPNPTDEEIETLAQQIEKQSEKVHKWFQYKKSEKQKKCITCLKYFGFLFDWKKQLKKHMTEGCQQTEKQRVNFGNDEELFVIEKILDKRILRNGIVEYFIKWERYGIEDSTWESKVNLEDTTNTNNSIKIEAFEKEYNKQQKANRKRKVTTPVLNSNIVMKCNYCDRYFSENSDRKNEFGDCLIFTNHRETNPMKHCKVPNCSMKFCTSEGLILHQKNLHISSVTTTKLELPKIPIVIQSSSPTIMMPSTKEKQVSAMVDNNFKKCEWCDRTFAYDSDKMTEFGECKLFGVRREKNPMKHCNVCSMKFCTSEGLILHLKNSHKIEGNFTEILRQNTQAAYYNNQKSASHQKKQQIITATDLKIVPRVPSYNVISDKVYENLISSEKIMPVRTAEIISFKQSINNTNSIQNNSFVGNFEDDQQNHSDSKLQNLKVAYQVVQTALKDKDKLQAIQQVLESKKDIVDDFNQKVLNNSRSIDNQNGLEVSHNDDDDEVRAKINFFEFYLFIYSPFSSLFLVH